MPRTPGHIGFPLQMLCIQRIAKKILTNELIRAMNFRKPSHEYYKTEVNTVKTINNPNLRLSEAVVNDK